MTLSVVRLSPLGSQLSFGHSLSRIESITDWEAIAKKYRDLVGEQGNGEHSVRSDALPGPQGSVDGGPGGSASVHGHTAMPMDTMATMATPAGHPVGGTNNNNNLAV